ncbi:MAG: hypothetical protein LH606_03290 [Cytophagaceae bacterium]|nr:hypothetical protein [Cytophagaceae bacterium]
MTATFELSTEEWDEAFFKQVKTLFKSGRIRVSIEPEEMDTTEYLMSTEANRNALEESIEQAQRGEFIPFDLETRQPVDA